MALYQFVRSRRINQNPQSPAVQSRQQQALAAVIIETAVEGVITIDDTGKVQASNAAAEKMFGYIAAEVIGQNVSLLMPVPYEAQHDQYIAHYLKTGERKIIGLRRELSGLRKNGEEFPMDLAIGEVILEGKRSFAGIVRDMSERSGFFAEIEASQRQLRQIIDLVPHMIFAKDVDGRIILANQAAANAYQSSVDKTPALLGVAVDITELKKKADLVRAKILLQQLNT